MDPCSAAVMVVTLMAGALACSATLSPASLSGMNQASALFEQVCWCDSPLVLTRRFAKLQAEHEACTKFVGFDPSCRIRSIVLDRESCVSFQFTSSQCCLPSATPWSFRASWTSRAPPSLTCRANTNHASAWLFQLYRRGRAASPYGPAPNDSR